MRKTINFLINNFKVKAGTLIALTAVAYGLLINNLNLWTDEIYSVLMAKESLSDMWILLVSEDSKPPLYYLYLKGILTLFPAQYEIWAAHFASAVLLIAAQIFAATIIRRDFGDNVSLWCIVLLALIPQSLWLALEVRTYMLSSLLLLIAAVYGWHLINQPKNLDFIIFGVVSLCALYTHYYCAIWLMFCYMGILYYLIKDKTFSKYGIKFLITAVMVALLFLPWLYVPFANGSDISSSWYVNESFVLYSWQFFINPLQPEIFQSVFLIATTFSACVFSFILLLGVFDLSAKKSKRIFVLTFGCFITSYLLLILLSYTFRPMVTARYLKIFTLVLYLAGAVVLAQHKNIRKAFALTAIIGFIFTWADIRAISFDKGYQNVINDIRRFISPSQPLIALDNSNIFCEYYLPEYKCLPIIGETGEILRKPSIAKLASDYQYQFDNVAYTISIYNQPISEADCQTYQSFYRYGQNVSLCRFSPENAHNLLKDSLYWIQKRVVAP